MKTKAWLLWTVTIVFAAILTACGGNPDTQLPSGTPADKTELILAIGGEPDEGFDPCTGWGRYGSPLFQSTLLSYDKDMKIENDLATGYRISSNGLIWTFGIRPDVKFSDGSSLKASDIAFTYNTAKVSNSEIDLTRMKEARALDDTTVEFVMNSPMSPFLSVAASLGIVPEAAYSPHYGQNPIGSGPYKFVQWDKGQQLIVELNEDYYGVKPVFTKLTLLFIGEDTALAAVKAGTVDVAMTAPSFVSDVPGYSLLRCASVDNRGMSMPVTKSGTFNSEGVPVGNDVTSDITIRRAVCYGIDRQKIVNDALISYGSPAYSVCDGLPWYNLDTKIEDGKIEEQKAILEADGWIDNGGVREKNGLRASFELYYPASDSLRQAIALAISQQAREMGIEIKTIGGSWDDLRRMMYSQCILFGWGSYNPMEIYYLFYGKEAVTGYSNPTNAVNPVVDRYIDAALNSLTEESAYENWQKAQWDGNTGLSMLGDASWCWVINVDHLYYVREGLSLGNQRIHPHGHGYPVISNISEWHWQ
ncbi:MAG: ABC transporter substrate-binding protein [Peptococcaceae bacterium]|nr:ABC transporter substrate-binding protein [Peptococcaceae bacterium]